MEIKLRGFEFGDLPKLSKILKKMELKEDLKKLFSTPDITGKKKEEIDMLQEQLGAELAATAFCNLYLAEIEVYDFIGGLTELKPEEVKKMSMDDMIKLFTEFGKSASKVIDFFKLAAK